VNLTDAFM